MTERRIKAYNKYGVQLRGGRILIGYPPPIRTYKADEICEMAIWVLHHAGEENHAAIAEYIADILGPNFLHKIHQLMPAAMKELTDFKAKKASAAPGGNVAQSVIVPQQAPSVIVPQQPAPAPTQLLPGSPNQPLLPGLEESPSGTQPFPVPPVQPAPVQAAPVQAAPAQPVAPQPSPEPEQTKPISNEGWNENFEPLKPLEGPRIDTDPAVLKPNNSDGTT